MNSYLRMQLNANAMQDLNEYLPPITMQWCHNTLQAGQFSLPITAGAANDEGD